MILKYKYKVVKQNFADIERFWKWESKTNSGSYGSAKQKIKDWNQNTLLFGIEKSILEVFLAAKKQLIKDWKEKHWFFQTYWKGVAFNHKCYTSGANPTYPVHRNNFRKDKTCPYSRISVLFLSSS